MSISELKAKSITACPGGVICVAEAKIPEAKVFVTYTEDDLGEHYTVSAESMYTYLTENLKDVPELTEEYSGQKDAKGSGYWKVFAFLKKTLKGMDEGA